MAAVIDKAGLFAGIFTDGDLRRVIDAKVDIHHTPIGEVITRNAITAHKNMLAAEALNILETKVLDEQQQPIGAFNMLDLLKSGVA